MHVTFGQYHVRDVKFVAAFDVDAKKVGFDLSEAIFASENNTIKIADVPPTDVLVQRGPTLDGIGKYYADTIDLSDAEPVDVVKTLKDAKVDVMVSYLPVGSEEADKFYAQCAIDAGVAFVNALPVFIASDPVWAKKFEDAGVPIVGDDIKSQVGATITHRVMAKLFEDRGVTLDRTYQLNVGGNMDFKNMLERERLESKKVSKTQAVTSNLTGSLAGKIEDKNVHIGPSDHVALARRPQVGLRPSRGPRLRRRAAEPGVQARGVGLAELGGHHHRRGARGEDRQGPRHRRPDHPGLGLPDEEPAEAAGRRRRAHAARRVHRRQLAPDGGDPLRPDGGLRNFGAVTETSDDELTGLPEFALLAENAEQAGVSGPLPDVAARRRGRDQRAALGHDSRHGWSFCTAADRTRTPGTP